MAPVEEEPRQQRRVASNGAIVGRTVAHRYGSLPSGVLAQIAEAAVACAENALVTKAARCVDCQRHLRLGCSCLRSHPRRAAAQSIDRCANGSRRVRPGKFERVYTENVAAYRTKLLGAVQSMRLVCKCWRDSVTYDPIDSLQLQSTVPRKYLERCRGITVAVEQEQDELGRLRPKKAARALVLPDRFQQRFSSVKVLNLSGVVSLPTLPDQIRGMAALRVLVMEDIYMGAMPQWFSELRLTHLRISWYSIAEPSDHEMIHQRQEDFFSWLTNEATRLPITLTHLKLRQRWRQWNEDEHPFELQQLPPCIRYLTELQSLSMTASDHRGFFDVPAWLTELGQLKLFQYHAYPSAASARIMGSMPLKYLDIHCEGEDDDGMNWWNFLPTLLAPPNAIRSSLRGLRVSGGEDQEGKPAAAARQQLPLCLRGLQLTSLDLGGSEDLNVLPEWLGEMPLVYLGLGGTFTGSLNSLPVSLRAVTSLRLIDIEGSQFGLQDCDEDDDEPFKPAHLSQLLELSAAVPELMFRITSWRAPWKELGDERIGWSHGVWHPTRFPQLPRLAERVMESSGAERVVVPAI
jgi:hypothetical protein